MLEFLFPLIAPPTWILAGIVKWDHPQRDFAFIGWGVVVVVGLALVGGPVDTFSMRTGLLFTAWTYALCYVIHLLGWHDRPKPRHRELSDDDLRHHNVDSLTEVGLMRAWGTTDSEEAKRLRNAAIDSGKLRRCKREATTEVANMTANQRLDEFGTTDIFEINKILEAQRRRKSR